MNEQVVAERRHSASDIVGVPFWQYGHRSTRFVRNSGSRPTVAPGPGNLTPPRHGPIAAAVVRFRQQGAGRQITTLVAVDERIVVAFALSDVA